MKPGGGARKGARFERKLCVALSKWVSAGKRSDLFWRSAISGGRATVAARKGIDLAHQAGDIVSVSPEGHKLTAVFYIELKHRKNLALSSFLLRNSGPLSTYWKVALREAHHHGRFALLIARQDNLPTVVVCEAGCLHHTGRTVLGLVSGDKEFEVHVLDELLRVPFKKAVLAVPMVRR